MTEDSMHRTLNAALARNSGPSAEDVEALALVFREAIFAGGSDPTWLAEALTESSWLATHTAAAKREGARAAVEAVEVAAGRGRGWDSILAAAREAAARVEGGA